MNCPTCGKCIDAHTHLDYGKIKPRPNDVSVCAYCGTLSVFDKDIKLQKCSEEEEKNIEINEPELWHQVTRVRQAILNIKAEKN